MSIHRFMSVRVALAVLGLGAVLGTANAAKAAVTFSYGGTITLMDGIMSSGPFSIGDPLSIVFTYDETTADSDVDNEIGNYQNAVTSYTVIAGPYTAQGLFQTGDITIFVDLFPSDTNRDEFRLTDDFPVGPAIGGRDPIGVFLNFVSLGGLLYDSDDLPLAPPDKAAVEQLKLDAPEFTDPVLLALDFTDQTALGSIQSTNIVPLAVTPVPAALPLFLSALAGLGFFGWRRRKQEALA